MNETQLDRNSPLSVRDLERGLAEALASLAGRVGQAVRLEPLGRQKEVLDSTTKALVRTASNQGVAVVLCSRPIAPDLAERGHRNAGAIRAIIGERLGQAIIRPIGTGVVEGRSYVILPCCREFSSSRVVRVGQRLRLKNSLLRWLLEANRAAANSEHQAADAGPRYMDALRHLEGTALFSGDIQEAIRHAMARLESGYWSPRHTIDHNDLWLGNVMLPPKRNPLFEARTDFILIDWVGANPAGFGIYDLVRLSRGLKLSTAALRRELRAHAEALGCELSDTRGHLLAGLGRLHMHLEHFPEERYLHASKTCWNALEAATRHKP